MSDEKGRGMITKIWGPPAWVFLHSIAAGYPLDITKDPEKKECTRKFFECLGDTLPCKYCRESYKEFIKKHPINDRVLSGRIELSRWLYTIHNEVNYKLGVKLCDIPTFEEVYNKYNKLAAACSKTSPDIETKKETGCTVPEDGKAKECLITIKDKSGNIIQGCGSKLENSNDLLLKFYRNETPIKIGNKNLYLDDVIKNIDTLQENKEYIYVLFPLTELPNIKDIALLPMLDDVIINSFRDDDKIQENFELVIRAICNMKGYNFSYNYDSVEQYWESNIDFTTNTKNRIVNSIKILNNNVDLSKVCKNILDKF